MALFNQFTAPANITTTPVINATLAERLQFMRKVYSYLALSIFLGIVASAITISNEAFFITVAKNIWIFFILEIGVLIGSNFVKKDGTAAFVMMNIFTILTGVTTAPIVYIYRDVALQAALTTVAIFVGLTIYTFISKKDFSFLRGMLFVGIIGMIVIGLINAFFFQSSATQMALSAFGVLLFSGFILYETSNIMRHYPVNMAVQATLSMYLNILNLFIVLLQLFGGSRK